MSKPVGRLLKTGELPLFKQLDDSVQLASGSGATRQEFDRFTVSQWMYQIENNSAFGQMTLVTTVEVSDSTDTLMKFEGHVQFIGEGHILANMTIPQVREFLEHVYKNGFADGEISKLMEIRKALGVQR